MVAIAAVTESWQAVICPATAHLHVDECGAPERVAGVKLITVETTDGKLTPELLEAAFPGSGSATSTPPSRGWSRSPTRPSSAPSTRPAEVRAIADAAHARGLLLHVDGARIANAAAAQGVALRDLTTDAGVDLLSFGGTKNGLLFGEAVVFLADGLGEGARVRPQAADAAGLEDALRRGPAGGAAGRRPLARATPRTRIGWPPASERPWSGSRESSWLSRSRRTASSPTSRAAAIERLELGPDGNRAFYVWDEPSGTVRLMCSWDTAAEDVDAFAASVEETVAGVAGSSR